jgi:hypothetical protein
MREEFYQQRQTDDNILSPDEVAHQPYLPSSSSHHYHLRDHEMGCGSSVFEDPYFGPQKNNEGHFCTAKNEKGNKVHPGDTQILMNLLAHATNFNILFSPPVIPFSFQAFIYAHKKVKEQ